MKDQDQLLLQSLDAPNFKTLLANAGKPLPNEQELKALNEVALRTNIDQIKQLAKLKADDPLVLANKALLDQGASVETWNGTGSFNISSAKAWAVGGGVAFPGELPLGFLFGGTGSSWLAWGTGTAVISGSFVLDPNKICLSSDFHTENSPIGIVRKGTCNFTASGGGVGISGMTISFYSNSGTFWGTLTGSGAIVGGFSVEGQLELTWQGWHV